MSDVWYHWPENREEMYRSDLVYWILNAIDGKITGEHNAGVERALNPKKKAKPGEKIESYIRPLAPPRWRSEIERIQKVIREKKKAEVAKKHQAEEGMIRGIIRAARPGSK